ncbi:hypothetical protein [Herbaspirillum rubrisubalbicans]|uniref:Uncharacterized protein n=1 Tax=Herbaspirillum rubrisubalbicans TaxID=80842 RepID=A0ABX9C6V6_9BURK|nr:hypothetical protein [Herbaspirillum rubrisubalbicans]RAM66155.1 hypothetical protein RB24_04015 [Herbaspirillum rubrisubalbicans]
MNDVGKLSHALYAVLYAAKNNGCDLDVLLNTVKNNISVTPLRPLPQDQEGVIETIKDAITAIRN